MELQVAIVTALGPLIVAVTGAIKTWGDWTSETERRRQRLFELADKLVEIEQNVEILDRSGDLTTEDRSDITGKKVVECIKGEINKEIDALEVAKSRFLDVLDYEGVSLMFLGAGALLLWGGLLLSGADMREMLKWYCFSTAIIFLLLGLLPFFAGKVRDCMRRRREDKGGKIRRIGKKPDSGNKTNGDNCGE